MSFAIKNFGLMLIWLIFSASASYGLQVQSIEVQKQLNYEQVSFHLSVPASAKIFGLKSPDRLVIDLPSFRWQVLDRQLRNLNSNFIGKVRHSQFNADTSRIVLDLTQPVAFKRLSQGTTSSLIITLRPVGVSGRPTPAIKPLENQKDAHPYALPTSQAYVAKESDKPLIFIDAGHGGKDPGAIGASKIKEKVITLRYAKALQSALLKTGKYRVQLTRDKDNFIILRDRYRKARKAGADLFISLHADSAPTPKARGLSIYTLSENASDKEAAKLAAQENKVDLLADVDLSHEDEQVAGILIDLARRETKNKSVKLAENLVKALKPKVKLLTNPLRFAGFAVLKAPDIPSILVEIGFLTNRQEESLLKSSSHRKKVVAGMVKGINAYYDR